MPTPVVIICTILCTVLMLTLYIQRYIGMYRNTYEVNPLSPLSWAIGSAVGTVFLIISENFVLAGITVLSFSLQMTLFIWSTINTRHCSWCKWKVTPADFVCLGVVIVATAVYILTDNVNLGVAIMFVGWVFGEIPQLRKAYFAPQADSVQFYLIPMVRNIFLFGTLTTINFVGLMNTLYWVPVAVAEVVWIVYCKKRRGLTAQKQTARMPKTCGHGMTCAKT